MKKTILVVLALALAGCGSVNDAMQMERFEDATRSYENSIRWGYYDAAIGVLKLREGEKPPRDIKALEKIKVTSYELISLRTFEDETRVEQTVRIKYYFMDELLEKNLIDKQLWEYDATGAWRLLSGLPDFK